MPSKVISASMTCGYPELGLYKGYIKVLPKENHSGTPTTERTGVKKDQGDATGSISVDQTIFCLISLCLSLFIPAPLSHFFLAFTVK